MQLHCIQKNSPMKMRILPLLLLMPFLHGMAQPLSGVIHYDRTEYWTRIVDKLPYLSAGEKERVRVTWGRTDGWTTQMLLHFDTTASLYAYDPDRAGKKGTSSWREEDLFLLRDLTAGRRRDIIELPDRTYLVEDDLPAYKWKILSEIRDIQGYICMSAETTDTLKGQRVVAWFTTELPLPYGPEQYGGLPGIILELDIDQGAVLITATQVDRKALEASPTLPKRKKLQRIDAAEYHRKVKRFLDDSIEARENPYWELRY
jgi:GLPGLI family protein